MRILQDIVVTFSAIINIPPNMLKHTILSPISSLALEEDSCTIKYRDRNELQIDQTAEAAVYF